MDNSVVIGPPTRPRRARSRQVISNLRASPSALLGCGILALHLGVAIFAPVIAPYSPTDINPELSFNGPSWVHPFGTDQLGRDILSRVIYGGRSVLVIAFVGTAIAVAVGGLLGLLLGYVRGVVDELSLRVLDAIIAVPSILWLLVVITTLGSSELVIILAMATTYAPGVVRSARAAALDVIPRDFVTAARARGERALSIVAREIRPNALDVLFVEFAMRASWALLLVSALSFLGFGVNPPTPNWGLMIADNRGAMAIAPWATLFPVLALGSLVIAVNLATDGLAKALGLDLARGAPD